MLNTRQPAARVRRNPRISGVVKFTVYVQAADDMAPDAPIVERLPLSLMPPQYKRASGDYVVLPA